MRFPSLSPPILTIDAETSTALAYTCILSANLPLPATFPPSSRCPSLLLGLPKAGLPPWPLGHLVTRSKSGLGCYKEIPGSTGEQWEFVGLEKRLAVNCVRAKKPWIQGQVFPEPNQVSTCLCLGKRSSPFRISPQLLQGVAVLCKVCWWQGPSFPTLGRTRLGDLRSLPLGGWGETFPP